MPLAPNEEKPHGPSGRADKSLKDLALELVEAKRALLQSEGVEHQLRAAISSLVWKEPMPMILGTDDPDTVIVITSGQNRPGDMRGVFGLSVFVRKVVR